MALQRRLRGVQLQRQTQSAFLVFVAAELASMGDAVGTARLFEDLGMVNPFLVMWLIINLLGFPAFE